MAIYGYARCSTSEDKQDINRQIRELKTAGAEEVRENRAARHSAGRGPRNHGSAAGRLALRGKFPGALGGDAEGLFAPGRRAVDRGGPA